MKYQANIRLSKNYYEKCYQQANWARRKGNIIRVAVDLVLLVGALSILALTGKKDLVFYAVVGVSIFDLVSPQFKKYFWIKRQLSNKSADSELSVLIDEFGYKIVGPFSTIEQTWEGIDKVMRTPEGVLIWPQKGAIIYMSESDCGKSLVDFVASKNA